jgi:drug/metabolite transporter (DMT)-like permease
MAAALAILASLFFAIGAILSRRGSMLVSPTSGAQITVLLGPPIFALLAFIFGEIDESFSLPLLAYGFFGLAGVLHFVGGRSLQYLGIQAIGAARATVIITLSPLVSVLIATIVFDETPGWAVGVGAVLLVMGPILIVVGERRRRLIMIDAESSMPDFDLARGFLLSGGAAVVWGVTPILVKAGLNESDFPVLGIFVSSAAAAIVVGGILSRPGAGDQLLSMNRTGVRWYVLAGLAVSSAHFVRYLALSEGDVTIVVLMFQLVPLFVFLLTWAVNREIETLNAFLLAGGVAVVAGSTVVIAFQNT